MKRPKDPLIDPRNRAATMMSKHMTKLLNSVRIPTLCLVLVIGACVATPMPLPPTMDFEVTEVCPETIRGEDNARISGTGQAGTTIWVYNLETEAPPSTALVDQDGAFSLTIPGEAGDEIRVQARDGDLRSDPADMLINAGGRPTISERSECLVFDPPYELEITAEQSSFVIRNDCSEGLSLDAFRLRSEIRDFLVVSSIPPRLAPGETTEVIVELSATEAGFYEEILLINFSGPITERRPITLYGTLF